MLSDTKNAVAKRTTSIPGEGDDQSGTEPLYCRHCGFVRSFHRLGASHRQHLAATVLTFGLWSVGWLVAVLQESQRPWRCTVCQTRYTAARHGDRRSASRSNLRFRQMSVRLLAR